MKIRIANVDDAAAIRILLGQLGYPFELEELMVKVDLLLSHPDHCLVVAEQDVGVVGVMSVHFLPQLALAGDFAIISYLVVDSVVRGTGIGRDMERFCVELARERKCDRIQVHCSSRRIDAHRFYEREGYVESRKYFSKSVK